MQDRVVRNHRVHFPSLFISIFQTVDAFPVSWCKHLTSFVDKIAAAYATNFPVFLLINVRPTLWTPWLEFIIILRRSFWNIILVKFLSIFGLNALNFLSAVRTAFVKLPPTFGTVNTAEFMFAVEGSIISGIDLIETDSTHFDSGSGGFVLRFGPRKGCLRVVVGIFGGLASWSFLHVFGQK